MGQSLIKNYVHIVFSTKNRQRLILPPFDSELYAYIGGISNDLGCQSIIVGGHVDHVHILTLLSNKIPLMTLVQKIKASSSKWIKTKGSRFEEFYWQKDMELFQLPLNR